MSASMIALRREDYAPPAFVISEVDLSFELKPSHTRVINRMKVTRKGDSVDKIELDGEQLQLEKVLLDGRLLQESKDYTVGDSKLSIKLDELKAEDFTLEIHNSIDPFNNTSLEGLYFVSGAYCTQCEAQGFRKITYFLDRPDILSIYTVTIICDDSQLKDLLSNGNKVSDEILDDGRRKVVWHDPHYKPCYLFALVAGDFDCLNDTFTTMEGRDVALQVFVDKGRLHQAEFAMQSLKNAMKWDEDTFGLAYDLDIYMIVAVDFFNMGAMENKGLNVFNSKFVLAEPATATDEDYFNIESIIAHEYFHNWTGNRVTCRDWFQLSLKEGLTVFRDQLFSADMGSALSCRIKQVKVMREHQFAEDAGPMSHPIRPDEVIEMNNFYTVTVYDKGAEVIRMLHTLLKPEGFRKGLALYFERFDGQAVTCDDFVQAMQDANQVNLDHFKLWYSQSGTPTIDVKRTQNGFSFEQSIAPTADQKHKSPLYLPLNFSVLDAKGKEHLIDDSSLAQQAGTVVINQNSTQLDISQALGTNSERAVPVLLADFSAPAKVRYAYTLDDIIHILQFAQNHYAKWDASQMLYTHLISERYEAAKSQSQQTKLAELSKAESQYLTALVSYIEASDLPEDVIAQLLSLPSIETLSLGKDKVQPLILLQARESVEHALADAASTFSKNYVDGVKSYCYAYEQSQVKQRSLKSVCLRLLVISAQTSQTAYLTQLYQNSDNMTDKLAVIKAAQTSDLAAFDKLMVEFEQQYGDDAVVMDKWFALHASTQRPDILSRLDLLQAHGQFSMKNPNKVRALVGSFAFYNTQGFHSSDGSGYRYVVNYLKELDKVNPQVASRIITPLLQLERYADEHRDLMHAQLASLFTNKGLSRDLFEKLSKTLA